MTGPDIKGMAQRIRETRKACNMSLDDVADAAGMSKTHIWEIEKGRTSNPTINAVWSISGALGVTPSWLLGVDVDHSPIDPLALEIATLIDRRLNERLATGERV